MRTFLSTLAALALLAVCSAPAPAQTPAAAAAASGTAVDIPAVPDVPVLDQDGTPRHFYSDLVKGHTVALNFIFTTCTTICPPMGANFAKLQKLLGDRDVRLISVSVDPAHDTPERLKAWAQKFGAGPGWTLVTGDREEVTRLLKALGVYTANPASHSPLVLLGNDASHRWTRANGLTPPAQLAALLGSLAPAPAGSETGESPAHQYFGDVKLIDQDGREVRLYTDLMQGKTVVINPMFTSCTGSCPVMSGTVAKIQEHLGDRVGRDVRLLSITVDPVHDTPAKLKEYAARFHARPGWLFLTGSKENVEAALRKLGQWVDEPANHQTLLLIGNDRTGLWKKAFALAKPEEILPVVDSVVNDNGDEKGAGS